MGSFDSKSFNEKAFKYSVEHPRIPNLKTNELKKSKALKGSKDIRDVFSSQNGTVYAEIAMKGLLDGQAVNYDGETDITATSTKTFNRGVVVIGRAKAWTEKDFSDDISGEKFMTNVADQVAEYKDGLDQDTILAILKGIYSMSGAKNTEFVNKHTLDISNSAQAASQVVGQTTLNTAINKACGANKKKFTLVFMHSDVSTNLENLKLVEHLKYTDAQGIERPLDLAAWNGKIVIIDDDMPVEEVVSTPPVYSTTISTAATAGDKITIAGIEYTFVANDTENPTATQIKVGASGTATQQATNIAAAVSLTGFTVTASSTKVKFTAVSGTNPDAPVVTATKADTTGTLVITNATDTEAVLVNKYTTYVLGDGAIDYEDIGAKKPYAMERNESRNGGEDTLYMRQRKVFAPFGISFTKESMAKNSPTNAELENGANWEIVHSGETVVANRSYINHKAIPIARIISKG